MPLTNTWYYTFNDTYAPASALDMARYILWHSKAFLKGELTYVDQTNAPAALPVGVQWVCEGSSDGVTGAHDGVDRWTNVYNGALIVRGTGAAARSWITLTSPTIKGQTWYMLIAFDGSNDYSATVAFSRIAFTGGTVTATPTNSTFAWGFYYGSVGAIQFFNNTANGHKFHSGTSDGSGFYMLCGQTGGGGATTLTMFRALEDVTAGEQYPLHTRFEYFTGPTSSSGLLGGQHMGQFGSSYGSGVCRGRMPCTNAQVTAAGIPFPLAYLGYWADSTYFLGPDFERNAYPVWPCWVIEAIGRPSHVKGRVSDMYTGRSNLASGTTAPAIGTTEYALFNHYWLSAPTTPTF